VTISGRSALDIGAVCNFQPGLTIIVGLRFRGRLCLLAFRATVSSQLVVDRAPPGPVADGSHSRSASLDIDNRKALALVGATTASTTTIPGDRAAISELPLAEAFR
jgi:hypothetical protein